MGESNCNLRNVFPYVLLYVYIYGCKACTRLYGYTLGRLIKQMLFSKPSEPIYRTSKEINQHRRGHERIMATVCTPSRYLMNSGNYRAIYMQKKHISKLKNVH